MKEQEIKIKLCGFQSIEPAVVAAEEGVDYLGFVFVPGNKYYIEPFQAKQIIDEVRRFNTGIVGIFIDEQVETINSVIRSVGLTHVQLHGNEPPEYCRYIDGAKIIKAFGVDNNVNTVELLDRLSRYSVDFYIIDRIQRGSGSMVPFTFAKEVARQYPIFLAGGITAENVLPIIREVNPFGIDVASGVDTDGRKNTAKIKELISLIKGKGQK